MTEPASIHRSRRSERPALIASLAGYTGLLAWTIPTHEPWADEAQAWQIARCNSFVHLFRTAIHYEFSTGLWHALLWALVRLHVSYAGLPWISAAIALCGVLLILFASPFPLALRLALPFTYFFAYQYAVVARSYVLFAPLLFLLAALWSRRERYPIVMAWIIGLLANVSSHALITAIGLVAVVVLEQWTKRRKSIITARQAVIAAATVGASFALAIWCLLPPPDAHLFVGIASMAHHPATTVETMNTGSHPLTSVPLLVRIPLGLLARFLYALSFGVSPLKTVAWIAWILLLWRWWREGRMLYAIPIVLLGMYCAVTRFEMYHAGLVWVLLLFLWWVTWPATGRDPRQRGLVLIFGFFLLCQVWWTAQAVSYDRTHRYSPDRAAAPVLRRYLDEGRQVDVAVPPPAPHAHGEYFAVGLEPYFAVEPFHDVDARYWIWRPHPAMYASYVRDTEARSAVVLVEEISNDHRVPEEEDRLALLGYRRDASICGQVFYPREQYPELCHVFYVPN
jgi:hypothetical protein